MNKAKLIIAANGDGKPIIGRGSKLVDFETGEEIRCVQDMTLEMPLKGVLSVTARILIHAVEVMPEPPLPIERK